MPIKNCELDGQDGYKYGDHGTCYTGKDGKQKAINQAIAIGVTEAFAGRKVGFDYDQSLTTERGKQMAKDFLDQGYQVYVISARQDEAGMYPTTLALGIPTANVYAVGSNDAKIKKVLELRLSEYYDNNIQVITKLPAGIGKKL
jgi:hypothetical protein